MLVGLIVLGALVCVMGAFFGWVALDLGRRRIEANERVEQARVDAQAEHQLELLKVERERVAVLDRTRATNERMDALEAKEAASERRNHDTINKALAAMLDEVKAIAPRLEKVESHAATRVTMAARGLGHRG